MTTIKSILLIGFIFAQFSQMAQAFTWNIDKKDQWGNTALHHAAGDGEFERVEHLLDEGADVNNKNKFGDTALLKAMYWRHYKIAKLLLTVKGIDVQAKNTTDGKTALYHATLWFWSDIVKDLLEKGADVDAKDNGGWTALHSAASSGHYKIIELLLEYGADVNIKSKRGDTALYYAAGDRYSEMVKLLLTVKGIDVNNKNKYGRTALHNAALRGRLETVNLLLAVKGIDIEATDKDGCAAFHLASNNGYSEVAALFTKSSKAATAAIEAKNIADAIEAKNIADAIEAKNNDLHRAAGNGKSKFKHMKYLLDNGADVNARDKDGLTPLHKAARKDSFKVVKFLLDNGADVNAKDIYGFTPLDEAVELDHSHIIELLRTWNKIDS